MNIYEAAMSHAESMRGSLEFVEVPEWQVDAGDGSLQAAKIYFYKNLTVNEQIEIAKAVDQSTGNTDPEFDFLVAKTCFRNADGSLIFGTSAQYRQLRENYDAGLIKQILSDTGILERYAQHTLALVKKRLRETSSSAE